MSAAVLPVSGAEEPSLSWRTLGLVLLAHGVALAALSIIEQGKAKGLTFATADVLIGATAIAHGITVATRNVRDFVPMGVPVFDPWAA